MELTESTIADHAQEYATVEPLYAVEQQHIDMLPQTFASSDYGRRDVQWVVRWYFRRYLGQYPDQKRREREEAFRTNEFEDVLDTLGAVATGTATRAETLQLLTNLAGVDGSLASAFLQFTAPQRYVTADERTWRVLKAAGELESSYPETCSIEAYATFDTACQRVCERTGTDAWSLYRALWRGWKHEYGTVEQA